MGGKRVAEILERYMGTRYRVGELRNLDHSSIDNKEKLMALSRGIMQSEGCVETRKDYAETIIIVTGKNNKILD